jgi:hypothetical protein
VRPARSVPLQAPATDVHDLDLTSEKDASLYCAVTVFCLQGQYRSNMYSMHAAMPCFSCHVTESGVLLCACRPVTSGALQQLACPRAAHACEHVLL